MRLDELADVVDGARGLRAAHHEQVLAVAGDAVHRRAQARIVGHLGARLALRHPGPEDLLADVLDLDRAGLVGQVGERRLHRDQPVEQVLLVVLEADVQDVGLAAGCDVARHLEGHRRLAGALRAADQEQLARPQALPIVLSSGVNPSGTGWYSATLAAGDLVVEVDQDVERRSGYAGCRYRCRDASSGGRGGLAVALAGAVLVSVVTGASVLTRWNSSRRAAWP